MNETLQAELLEMERIDRGTRADLVERGALHTNGYHPEMEAIHRRNNARMRSILETYGWPGRSLVGEDGCRAAGFIVQHAILDPDVQQLGLKLLTGAVAQHEAEPFMFALLTDRILMQEGKPQIYGSQYVGAEGGGVEPWPIADPETVDERRRSVDMMTLAENTARLNAQHHEETVKTQQ